MIKDQFKFDYYLKILRFNLINKITSFGYSFPKIEKNINIKNSIEKQGSIKLIIIYLTNHVKKLLI